jgi:hypothetical protein
MAQAETWAAFDVHVSGAKAGPSGFVLACKPAAIGVDCLVCASATSSLRASGAGHEPPRRRRQSTPPASGAGAGRSPSPEANTRAACSSKRPGTPVERRAWPAVSRAANATANRDPAPVGRAENGIVGGHGAARTGRVCGCCCRSPRRVLGSVTRGLRGPGRRVGQSSSEILIAFGVLR